MGWQGRGGPSPGGDSDGARRCSGLHRVQTEGEVIEQGRQHLQSYLGELLDAIVRSAPACPPVIRAAFRQLFQRVGERFPQHQVGLWRGLVWGQTGTSPEDGALWVWSPAAVSGVCSRAGGQRAAPTRQPWTLAHRCLWGCPMLGEALTCLPHPLGGHSTPNLWLSPASSACASSRRP